MKVKVTQSCLTLLEPMDYTVHGIIYIYKHEVLSILKSMYLHNNEKSHVKQYSLNSILTNCISLG